MSYVLAFLGFAALIILHEFGHFAAAKAVGMRVERFSLFFGPLLVKFRRGETEYGIGPIPLGGYVRITGMNPNEAIPPEVEDRAYYRQPVWKRVVVILAGPAMNLLIAFVILFFLFLDNPQPVVVHGTALTKPVVAADFKLEKPAAGVLRPGDRILSVDGVTGGPAKIRAEVNKHKCAGPLKPGCQAATPVHMVVLRHGKRLTLSLRPRYDSAQKRMLVGFAFVQVTHNVGAAEAARLSIKGMWTVTTRTVSVIVRIFEPQQRKQLGSVVGGYRAAQQSFAHDTTRAWQILALISLSLAVVNLFPFLPLDGGHIFWALAETVRGRPIPFSVMERASVVGFGLVLLIFVIGLTNDIHNLGNGAFNVR
ncbi:MAG: peptidase [Solirubrobacterales bacterium]|nr:peptidase [Solirubrobacterales bacterium]